MRNYGLIAQDARRIRLPFDPRGDVVPSRLAFGLLAVAGAVLLIALINLTGLPMARGIMRWTEIAVRLTLGASRWRVTRRLRPRACCSPSSAAGSACGLAVRSSSSSSITRRQIRAIRLGAVHPRCAS